MTVRQIFIAKREAFAGGRSFGDAGPYERLVGRVELAVDPRAPKQQQIDDIDLAPVDDSGMVRFAADLMILKPLNPRLGNRRLLFEFANRGNKLALHYFNDAPRSNDPLTPEDAGNGYLMRCGYTVVWVAWQADLLPGEGRLLLDAPTASRADGPVTGQVVVEYIGQSGVYTLPLSGRFNTRSHPAVSLDTRRAVLTKRRYPDSQAIPIPPETWSFARAERGAPLEGAPQEGGLIPSDTHIHLPAGFQPGWIYELSYVGKDPLVLGLGHACVRDVVSYLRYETGEGNPLQHHRGGGIEKAYAWGRSQAGRCIRDFIYRGFNADNEGRQVFSGVLPHIAGAGRLALGRFANLTVAGPRQYEDRRNTADTFPFAYAETIDHITGRRDAILKRPATDPLVIHTQSATEYWQRGASLVHTDTEGRDLDSPDTVRIYFLASSQHVPEPELPTGNLHSRQNLPNTVDTSILSRAMLNLLDRWATDGIAPPPSRVPTRRDRTLVPMDEWRAQFPMLPGVAVPRGPAQVAAPAPVDQASGARATRAHTGYTVLVPAVDSDGNDIAGIRVPMVAAPLGTYTGWNLRSRGHGHGALHDFSGSYIPFPDTAEERAATGDPRDAVLERYPSADHYVEAVRAAARDLVAQGLLLEEDVERAVAAAAAWGGRRHDVRL